MAIDAALRAALARDTVRPVMAVEIDWPGAPARAHTGVGNITLDGKVFKGVGDLGGISAVKQSHGESPSRLKLTISGFDGSVTGELMRASYIGRRVTLWMVALDRDLQVEAAQVIWRGSISDSGVSAGKSYALNITASNRLEDWDRKRADRFTDESQQARHPGDRIFIYMPAMAEYPIYWGSDKEAVPLKSSL